MKKLFLLALSTASLCAMHHKKQNLFIEGHSVQVRYDTEKQWLFARFVIENYDRNTYVSKNLRTKKFFSRTTYPYHSFFQGREIHLTGELDEEQATLLKTAINQFQKGMEID